MTPSHPGSSLRDEDQIDQKNTPLTKLELPRAMVSSLSDHSAKTCADCANIGVQYWGDDWSPIHHCGKSTERRRSQFQSCGDRSQDFMNEFRKFYDATPRQTACSFFVQRDAPSAEQIEVIGSVAASPNGRALFKFWSKENEVASQVRGRYLREDTRDAEHNGFRAYKITELGRAVLNSVQESS